MQSLQENVMASFLRSRKLIYQCVVSGKELTEEDFTVLFERMLSSWKRRIGASEGAKWVGRRTERGVDSGRGMRSGAARTFKEFEVYVLLPCAVRPRKRGSDFELNRPGWQVSETVRAQRTTTAEFFKKPLQEWARDGSGKSMLGPGLALRPLKSPYESVAEALDGAEDADGRKEERDSCGDTIHVLVRRTPPSKRSVQRL
jgi:hypothetical protein